MTFVLINEKPSLIKKYIQERLENPPPPIPEKVFSHNIKAGAILIPLFCKNNQLHLIMIKRSETLKRNPGDMAFPGGTIEENDRTWVDIALREANEEIGITPKNTEILGSLGEFPVATGKLRVIGIVGWVKDASTLAPLTSETDFIAEIPFSVFLNSKNYFSIFFHWGNIRHDYVRFFDTRKYAKNNIVWGMSAGMIRRFIDIMVPNNGFPEEDWIFLTDTNQLLI